MLAVHIRTQASALVTLGLLVSSRFLGLFRVLLTAFDSAVQFMRPVPFPFWGRFAFVIRLFCEFAGSNSYVIPQVSEYGNSQSLSARDKFETLDNSPSPGTIVIAGPIIGVLILCGAVVWIFMRSRPAATPQPQPISATSSEAASEKPDRTSELPVAVTRASWEGYIDGTREPGGAALNPSSTISTRDLYISNQIKRARQKVKELERVSLSLRTASAASPTSENADSVTVASRSDRQRQSGLSEDTTSLSPSRESLQEKLYGAREEIEILNSRIREFERQQRTHRGSIAGPAPLEIVEERR